MNTCERDIVVISNTSSCESSDIIEHLRGMLCDLNCRLHQCCCCDWIDHDGKKWHKCHKCQERICDKCYIKHTQNIITVATSHMLLCEVCHDDNFSE